jgi:hypothetical protein
VWDKYLLKIVGLSVFEKEQIEKILSAPRLPKANKKGDLDQRSGEVFLVLREDFNWRSSYDLHSIVSSVRTNLFQG